MGAMIDGYGHAIKPTIHEAKRALLEIYKRDYRDGTITPVEYISFLRSQIKLLKG